MGYRQSGKNLWGQFAKLMSDLFMDKTPVITTPDFNVIYDIFLGHESKQLTAKQFGTVTDLFMGYR